MNIIIDTELYLKIIKLITSNNSWVINLDNAGFSENSTLFRLISEYGKEYYNTGNNSGMAEIVSNRIPSQIQELYLKDSNVKDFFDSIVIKQSD